MNKAPELRLTPAALRALEQRDQPLLVELELLFSCLVRKRVKFPGQPGRGYELASGNPRLALHFRPIVTHHCRLEDMGPEQATDELPLAKPAAFVPRWVSLDYRQGQWKGDFGYAGE